MDIRGIIKHAATEDEPLCAALAHLCLELNIFDISGATPEHESRLLAFANAHGIPFNDGTVRFDATAETKMISIDFMSTAVREGVDSVAELRFKFPKGYEIHVDGSSKQLTLKAVGGLEASCLASAIQRLGEKIEPLLRDREINARTSFYKGLAKSKKKSAA